MVTIFRFCLYEKLIQQYLKAIKVSVIKQVIAVRLSNRTIGHSNGNGGVLDADETSTPQSERDQRMWSALKTSIMSDGEVHTDDTQCQLSIARTDISGASAPKQNDCIGANTLEGAAVKGTRNMESIDLEKGDTDGTLRPHRVASARLLESSKESSRSNKV